MKYAKYCRECGAEIEFSINPYRFDEITGRPTKELWDAICPNYGYADEGTWSWEGHYRKNEVKAVK
ncbi:hypothetical protein LCGC14_2810550 [marine sediment metagenome]|uniref:Uncharacterized protein n=1 Tax=marine sediment metagenome TaxID=412755 RepID=A0A0F9BBB6_9ZZZZ